MSDEPMQTETLERLKFAAMQTFSPNLLDSVDADVVTDIFMGGVCARLAASVYGKSGPMALEQRTYTEAAFPRWLPKRLKRRWSRKQTLRLEATPMLLFPDASFVPADKFGPAYFHVEKSVRSVPNPWKPE